MSNSDRKVVIDTARYIRDVRPIDPTEFVQYTGTNSVDDIRAVIRESAIDLNVIEREDGTFVPVDRESVTVSFDGVESLPPALDDGIEALLVEQYGSAWPHGPSGDELRDTIRRMKSDYFRGTPVDYQYPMALGYAVYHLPNYYAAIQYVLHELGGAGLLEPPLRILDVGAGVGGPALGIDAYLPDRTLVEYTAVEPSPARRVFERFAAKTGRNVHIRIRPDRAESFEPDGQYDLILFSNVLSELEEPVPTVDRYRQALEPAGAAILMSPADRNTSIGLRRVERTLVDERDRWSAYAPAVRLWPGERPTDTGWSFATYPSIDTPEVQRKLDTGRRETPDERPPNSGEFKNTSVQVSYAILRTDGKTRIRFRPDYRRVAKLGALAEHVTQRIDCVGVKLSDDLGTAENPVFRVGDGSQSTDVFAVMPLETRQNRRLISAPYGTGLRFENALVLWNGDEEAYNLVVDRESFVEAVP